MRIAVFGFENRSTSKSTGSERSQEIAERLLPVRTRPFRESIDRLLRCKCVQSAIRDALARLQGFAIGLGGPLVYESSNPVRRLLELASDSPLLKTLDDLHRGVAVLARQSFE